MSPDARRDVLIDGAYAVVIGFLVANRISNGALATWMEERSRHAADWLLHMKRIDDEVRREAPFVVFEAIQSLPEEPASEHD